MFSCSYRFFPFSFILQFLSQRFCTCRGLGSIPLLFSRSLYVHICISIYNLMLYINLNAFQEKENIFYYFFSFSSCDSLMQPGLKPKSLGLSVLTQKSMWFQCFSNIPLLCSYTFRNHYPGVLLNVPCTSQCLITIDGLLVLEEIIIRDGILWLHSKC